MHGVIVTAGGQRLATVSQWKMHVAGRVGLPDLRGSFRVRHAGPRFRDHAQQATPLQFELWTAYQTFAGLAFIESLTGNDGTFVAAGPWQGWSLE